MTKSLIPHGLCLLAVSCLLGTALLADEYDAPDTRNIKRTYVSIERTSEYPPPPNAPLTPGQGHEFVVVKIKIVAEKPEDVNCDASLVDSNGQSYHTASSTVNPVPGKPAQGVISFVFSVPKGLKLKYIEVGDDHFDLSHEKKSHR